MSRASQTPLIWVINAGSSSLKFSFFEGEAAVLTGQVDGIGGIQSYAKAAGRDGKAVPPPDLGPNPPQSPSDVLPAILPWVTATLGHSRIGALGHRVVHGGTRFTEPTLLTPELLDELQAMVPLAPLHEPYSLAPMQRAMRLHPEVPQVACFDTAFHRTAPAVNQIYALPYALYEEGIRRYGFHGLSYEYIASVLPEQAPSIAHGRVVVAHLGSGCSACAMQDRRSIATTMGFSALDGLPMGTRCGDLDPGIILYLLQQKQMQPDALTDLLYRRSGMLGLSGVSSDFRDLAASDDPRAHFAIEVFCSRVARHIASLAAAIGGLDGVVFTAGVGENSTTIRHAIGLACRWLGLELDEAANAGHATCISKATSKIAAYVIKTNENLMIARHVRTLVAL